MPRVAGSAPPDHVLRFWRSLDAIVGDVRPRWWGAVVTEPRFPDVWDVNYARIDVPDGDLTLSEIEATLLPALEVVGTSVQHLVSFHPGATRSLFEELESRGHSLTWDLVMELGSPAPGDHDHHRIEELPPGPELWGRVRASLGLFGVDAPVTEQLTAMERDVLAPGGKRWFGVRGPEGSIDSLGAFLVLDEVGYLDNIATFEGARRRGLASAVTAAVAGAARASGASHVVLLADPADRGAVGMYERLGFRGVGLLASSRGPITG